MKISIPLKDIMIAPGTDHTGGKEFIGNRWNDVHLTLARKKEASS